MNILDYGWNDYFASEWNKEASAAMFPARIIADYGQQLRVACEKGEILVQRPVNRDSTGQIAVGDWVALENTDSDFVRICFVLKRKTKFSRAAAGIEVKEQIVASNVDAVFLVQSLNRDFNMKRLERYLIAAWESGATPFVVLTKSDICNNVTEKLAKVYETAPGVEVHTISNVTGEGIDGIKKYLSGGKTVALLGSSGVGKSTLINTLAGEELLKTQAIREEDSHGRHTTTHRELVLLPDGGLILDTPGMRTLSLWEAEEGMDYLFGDIERLIQSCRFHDCTHGNEPGCAVSEALMNGSLQRKRWESWQKLQKELAHLEAKKDGKLRSQEKQWGKKIAKFQKEFYKGTI